MKKYILESAPWTISVLLLVFSIGYAMNDKESKTDKALNIPRRHIQVTDQRASVAPSVQNLRANPSDTVFGVFADWPDFSVGGIVCSSATYSAAGSFGDVNAGDCSTDTYGVTQGVAVIVEELCCAVAGDANKDGAVNVGDAVYMINYVFKSGPAPDCGDEGDANTDCALNVGDAVYLINYVFKNGPAPECGCAE